MWDQFCIAIERDDLLLDPRFGTGRLRMENADALRVEVTKWTTQRTKFEAMHLLCQHGVPASAVFDTMEVLHDPHLRARGFLHEIEHPDNGTVTLMGSPIRMSASLVEITAPPLYGADTVSVLTGELGLTSQELDELATIGAIKFKTTAAEAAE
jgi:formyl-CoA transferase